jgi:hypothetical protein
MTRKPIISQLVQCYMWRHLYSISPKECGCHGIKYNLHYRLCGGVSMFSVHRTASSYTLLIRFQEHPETFHQGYEMCCEKVFDIRAAAESLSTYDQRFLSSCKAVSYNEL